MSNKGVHFKTLVSGFCSESYFIKCFREAFGCTPGEMRKQGEPFRFGTPSDKRD